VVFAVPTWKWPWKAGARAFFVGPFGSHSFGRYFKGFLYPYFDQKKNLKESANVGGLQIWTTGGIGLLLLLLGASRNGPLRPNVGHQLVHRRPELRVHTLGIVELHWTGKLHIFKGTNVQRTNNICARPGTFGGLRALVRPANGERSFCATLILFNENAF
jgi:hypothetical protein